MFKIISDLGADIPRSLKTNDLTLINQAVKINGENKIYQLSSDEEMHQCFEDIENASTYATQAMGYQMLYDEIEGVAKNADVLCFSFSQKLSATGGQMQRACNDLNGKYGKVYYYDTQTATVGQGILVYYALLCSKNNKTIEETVALLDQLKEKLHFYVLLDKDNHFFRGGRCDDMQNKNCVYPLLYLPKGDFYKQVAEFLSPSAGLSFIEKKLQKASNSIIFIGHGNNVAQAQALAKKWQTYAPIVDVCYVNPVMGVHTGKDPILVAYLQDTDLVKGLS